MLPCCAICSQGCTWNGCAVQELRSITRKKHAAIVLLGALDDPRIGDRCKGGLLITEFAIDLVLSLACLFKMGIWGLSRVEMPSTPAQLLQRTTCGAAQMAG